MYFYSISYHSRLYTVYCLQPVQQFSLMLQSISSGKLILSEHEHILYFKD
uniref:Uncharacterized protein n=1 Tax=Anguilla anguilla TaxID=7936 RepID=A0A0E9XJ81_ANGAN